MKKPWRTSFDASIGRTEVLRLAIELPASDLSEGETAELVSIEQVAGNGAVDVRETGREVEGRQISFWYDGADAPGAFLIRFTLTTTAGETLAPELTLEVF
jgi:hypothetical protein